MGQSPTTTNEVYLTELHCYPYFESKFKTINKGLSNLDKVTPIMFAILFRYLLLCDQLHDFCQKDKRNEISNQPNWKEKRPIICGFFINKCIEDANGILGEKYNYDIWKMLLRLMKE